MGILTFFCNGYIKRKKGDQHKNSQTGRGPASPGLFVLRSVHGENILKKETIFVVGGCKSGKSRHALELAEQIRCDKRIFVATCVPYDDEMKKRVALHQKERCRSWSAIDVPVLVPEAIMENNQKENVIIVDCLTLWINNLIMELEDPEKISVHIKRLVESIEKAICSVVLVSNEVGTGIVPENKLARLFRDLAGAANQNVAKACDTVVWMVAGIPVPVKKTRTI